MNSYMSNIDTFLNVIVKYNIGISYYAIDQMDGKGINPYHPSKNHSRFMQGIQIQWGINL